MIIFKNVIKISLLLVIFACKQTPKVETAKTVVSKEIENKKDDDKSVDQEAQYYQINNDNEQELEKSTLKIKTEDFHSENTYKIIEKKKDFSVLVLFGYYEFGNYDEYIVTFDNSKNQISKELVSYNTAPDGNVEEYEYSNYRLDKNLGLEVFKVKVKEDLETNKIVKKDTTFFKFKITSEGQIIKI